MTAVIPTTGRASLVDAVRSVCKQSVPVWPVVVLDRPDKAEEVRAMLEQFRHTLVLTAGAEGGAAARNLGVAASETEFVAFLDDDDRWFPHKTETQLNACFAKAPGPFLSASAMVFDRRTDHVVVPTSPPNRREAVTSYMVQRPKLRYGTNVIQSSSLIVSREVVVRNPWAAGLKKHQDWDFVARVLADDATHFVWVNEPLVNVAQDSDGSISKISDWRASADFLEAHSAVMSPTAQSDFVWTHVVRGSLSKWDVAGLRYSASKLLGSRPHGAAIVVGLSGLYPLLKSKVARRARAAC